MLMENVGIYEDPSMEVLKSRQQAYLGYPDGLFQIKQEQSSEELQNVQQHNQYNFMAHMAPGFPPFPFHPPIVHPATPSAYRILSGGANQPPTSEQEQYTQGVFELAQKSIQQHAGYSTSPFGVPQGVPTTAYHPATQSVGLVAQAYSTNPDGISLKNPQLQMLEAQSNTSSPYSSREDLRSIASASHLGSGGSPASSDMDVYATNVIHEAMAEVPDMMNQERIKTERKKARNRIAAKKCRNSRLQREAEIEGTVRDMSQKNMYLQDQRSQLVEQVNSMKAKLMDHMRSGCPINVPSHIDLTPTSSSQSSSNTSSPLTVTLQA